MIIIRCSKTFCFSPSLTPKQHVTVSGTRRVSVQRISQPKRTFINPKQKIVTNLLCKSKFNVNLRRNYFVTRPLLNETVSSDTPQETNPSSNNTASARDIQTQIIQTHIKLRQYGEALQFIEDTLPQVPRTDNFYSTMQSLKVTCLFFLRRYSECTKTCRDMLEADYANPSAAAYKAICDYLRFKVDTDQAFRKLEDCLRQLRQDKEHHLFDFLVVHYYLARIDFVHNRIEEAEAHLDVLLDHPILFAGVYQLQGYLDIWQKKYEEAIESFDKELEWYEDRLLGDQQREQFVQAMLGKIHALQKLKRHDETLKCIKIAEKKNPEDIGDIELIILHKLKALGSSGRLQEMDELEIPKLSTSKKTKNRLEFEEFTKVFLTNTQIRRYVIGVAILFWILASLMGFYWALKYRERSLEDQRERAEEQEIAPVPIHQAVPVHTEEEYEDNQPLEEE